VGRILADEGDVLKSREPLGGEKANHEVECEITTEMQICWFESDARSRDRMIDRGRRMAL
jgi:hypothetical protein